MLVEEKPLKEKFQNATKSFTMIWRDIEKNEAAAVTVTEKRPKKQIMLLCYNNNFDKLLGAHLIKHMYLESVPAVWNE